MKSLTPDFNELLAYKDRKAKNFSLARRSVKSAISGNHHSPFRGLGLEFDAVREYVPGDDIRTIDWRVTARIGEPHIKVFKEERERVTMLCLDVNASMRFGTRNTFKSIQAARAAAFLGWHGLAQHDRISGCLFGDISTGIQLFPDKRGRASFCQMLKALSNEPTHQHHVSLDAILLPIHQAAQTGSLIYLISDFLDLKQESINQGILSRLSKRCDLVFIAINDPADSIIPPIGHIRFHQGDHHILVNTDNASGREAYKQQWERSRQSLFSLTKKFNISLIELTTESDIQREMLIHLKRIAKR